MNTIDVLPEKKRVIIPVKTSQSLIFLELKGDFGNNLVPSSGFRSKETGVLKGMIIYP